jgi:hypothetical protein
MSSVVINEFEVITEPPRPPAGAREGESAPPAPPAPTPQEIAHALRRQAERLARVRAT